MKSKDKSRTHIYIENKSTKSQLCGTQPSRKEQQFTKITQKSFFCISEVSLVFSLGKLTELGSSCKQYHFLRLKNFKFLIRTMNLVDGPTKNFIEYYITS